MSMTHAELRALDCHIDYGVHIQINPDIPREHHEHIRDRIWSYCRHDRAHFLAPLYGVNVDTGIWVGDGGDYDYRTHNHGTTYTIEEILNVRPKPATTHSYWTNP